MENVKKILIRKASIYLAFSMILAIVLGIIPEIQVYAASTKVGKPDISASANDSIITLRIGKTKNAEGFRIYAKEPNAQKYEKLETITQDGKKERTYSYTANESGEYAFKVKGYNKSTGETIWGEYSSVTKISVEVSSSQEKVDIKYGSIKMKVPKSWDDAIEDRGGICFYPYDGTFAMYYTSSSEVGELNQDLADMLIEEIGEDILDYKIISSNKTVYNEKIINTFYNYTFKAKGENVQQKGRFTIFEYDGEIYIMLVFCPESSKGSKRLFSEYSKVVKSIKPQAKSGA